MRVLKFSFLGILTTFIIGLVSNEFIGFKQAVLTLVLAIVGLILISFLKPFQYFKYSWLSLLFYAMTCFTFFSLGLVTYHIHDANSYQLNHIEPFMDNENHSISIVFGEELKSNSYNQRFYASLEGIDNKEVKGKLLVSLPLDSRTPKIGEQWFCYTRVSKLTPLRFLGSFDYSKYLHNQEVYGQLRLSENNSYKIGEKSNWGLDVTRGRLNMMERFQSAFSLNQASQLGISLLFGERNSLDSDLIRDFKNTGVMHVLAISGLHVGILFMMLQFLFKWIPRIPRELLILLCLWGFALLSGLSASVFRAVLMFTIVSVARLYRRQPYSMNTVGFAMLFSLCLNPKWIYDIGFQLSYAAVFSILFFYPIFKKYTYSKWWAFRYFKDLVAVSIAAQVGIFPLLLFYFHQFPWYFLLGNIVAIPLVTLLLFSGFIILFFSFVWLDLAKLVAYVFEWLSQLLVYGIKVVNGLPFGTSDNVVFHYTLLFSLGLFLFSLGVCLKRFNSKKILIVLVAIFIVQLNVFFIDYNLRRESGLIVSSDSKGILVFVKEKDESVVYSDHFEEKRYHKIIADYQRVNWIDNISFSKMPIGFEYNDSRYLVVSKPEVLYINDKQDVLLITNAVKLNYDRLFEQTDPKLVVLASNMPQWIKGYIKESCNKKRIPFHDISEKGFYKL